MLINKASNPLRSILVRASALAGVITLAACAAPVEDPTPGDDAAGGASADGDAEKTGSAGEALNNGSGNNVFFEDAGAWAWHSTVAVFTPVPGIGNVECTGTIIGPHHVITAASCFPSTSSTIGFFWDGVPDDAFTPRAHVLHVYEHSGVSSTSNWQDSNGYSWNIAVLQLDGDVPWQVPAWLNDGDPATDSWAFQVGLGAHNNNVSNFGILAEHQSQIRGSGTNYNANWLLTNDPASTEGTSGTHGGDTGGPLYAWGPAWGPDDEGSLAGGGLPAGQAMTLLGVYSGTNPWDWFGNRAGYTQMSWRTLGFIMNAMGMHISDYVGYYRTGSTIASFDATGWDAMACPDLCVKHHDCVADSMVYNTATSRWTCTLLRSVTGYTQYNYASSDSKTLTGTCYPDATGICRL